ncbi:Cyclin-dependent kinase b2-1 [Thalictrum thalictroides]|uniref:cyclin-dependent kinase n=1 Tax=Thalictrum thalictroides TaxID=46969 RepID=A0A7J6WF27_THATH|nr:Cyclin-dependent kinase b2-1 [Thalictrum thalictroides]
MVGVKKAFSTDKEVGIPGDSLREISSLTMLNECSNVVKLIDKFYNIDENGNSIYYLVFEYMEHDLDEHIKTFSDSDQLIPIEKVKDVMYQLLKGVDSCHRRGLHHGMITMPTGDRTPEVGTLHYQAPEVLLQDPHYSIEADMWSVGCIFAELATTKVLFPGNKDSVTQINLIFSKLGTPDEETWPGVTNLKMWSDFKSCESTFSPGDFNLNGNGIDLLLKMLIQDPSRRISAKVAMKHPFFGDLRK